MVMYPLHIAFGGFTIIGLTLLILAGSVAFYLMRLPSKSPATWSLIGFFTMVALSGGSTILANAFFYWDRLFIPWQDFWILAAGIALAQFAYRFPRVERSLEARAALVLMASLSFFALGYCLIFNYRFLFNWTPGLDVSNAYYLLLPIGTLLVIIIFLRRAVYFSLQLAATPSQSGIWNIGHHLIRPQGNVAWAFRSLALALSLAFLPGFQTLFGFPNPLGFLLSNIGSILAIIAIALVYFNFAPEVNSFMAKLVGITLSTVLLILTILGAVDIKIVDSRLSANRMEIVASVHDSLTRTGDLSADLSQVAYVVSWDSAKPGDAETYRQLYRATNEVIFNLNVLIDENRWGYLETWSQPVTGMLSKITDDDWRQMRRYWTYPLGSGQEDYRSFIFATDDMVYEIGLSKATFDDDISAIVSKWLVMILASSAFVLLIFPVFFRRILVEPLVNLLNGIRQVNQNDLEISIPVRFNDEIGFLTRSFNRMVSSLKEASFEIHNRALTLEAEVNQRTIELVQANEQLEKENTNRQKAEIRLNQQLLFQKALGGCSQSLLVSAEDESSQQEVLNQALEHLRSNTQVSRAYIFRVFEDSELGFCMGIMAEVCAPGIRAHISNLTNQKLPFTIFPDNVVKKLSAGEYIGGTTREVFEADPAFVEMFLTQENPLLSLQLIPIFYNDQWRGFVGFDDCITRRKWNQMEISALRTASEMIGSTLQRWELETQLRESLNEMEIRVQKRTSALSQANIKLNEEVQQRQQAQDNLEVRLQIEERLATISIRLQESSRIRANIAASLEDLAQIMDAGRILLVEFDLQVANQVREYIEWHKPEVQPLTDDIVQNFTGFWIALRDRLREGETIYIEDTSSLVLDMDLDLNPLKARDIQSLVLAPIVIDQRVHGVLGCSNLQVSPDTGQMNLRALELVANMLKSLLQREQLILTLEEQIAERTRQLTTLLDMAMLGDQAQGLADLLQPTLLAVTQIAGCDAAGIHIINEKNASLKLIAQRGIPLEFLQPLSELEIGAEFAIWLEETDPYEFLGDLARGPVFPEPFCFPGFRAFYANRLGTGSKSIGLLSCYRIEDQPFSPFQASLLTALGELMGIIVENYRLRGEAEELAAVEERQRLAREIHDAVSQSVYSLSLFARSANDALDDGDQGKLFANLQDIESTSLQAMREMRLLLYQLREAGREEDIATALDTRYKQVENRLGIQTSSDIETELFLPVHIKHQIWRIIVEALNNVVKHASATHVHVQINCLDENLSVSVRDHGIGFDIQDPSPGMGLKNMQSRAESLGGMLNIRSELGQGTHIMLNIPMACIDPDEGD